MLLRHSLKSLTNCSQFFRGITIRLAPKEVAKTFTTVDEFLKYHGYKHVNDHYTHTVYAGYDYGDTDHHFHMYPLNNAIEYADPDLDLIELLLKTGANPNINTKMSLGPVLHNVLTNSNQWNDKTIPLIKLLIKYGANINLKRKGDKNTPLHRVAYAWPNSRAEEIIKVLIDNGAKINVWDGNLKTPYNNVLESHKWYQYRNFKPDKILDILNPSLKDKYNRE